MGIFKPTLIEQLKGDSVPSTAASVYAVCNLMSVFFLKSF